jgi:hypothetical protein
VPVDPLEEKQSSNLVLGSFCHDVVVTVDFIRTIGGISILVLLLMTEHFRTSRKDTFPTTGLSNGASVDASRGMTAIGLETYDFAYDSLVVALCIIPALLMTSFRCV